MVTVTFWWRLVSRGRGTPKGDMIRKGNGIEGEKFPRNAAFSNYLALIYAKAPKCSSKTTTLKENVSLFELPLPESGCCNTSKKITTGIQPRGSEMPQSSSIFLKDGTEGVKKFLVCSKIIWCVNWLFASMRNGCEWAESFLFTVRIVDFLTFSQLGQVFEGQTNGLKQMKARRLCKRAVGFRYWLDGSTQLDSAHLIWGHT